MGDPEILGHRKRLASRKKRQIEDSDGEKVNVKKQNKEVAQEHASLVKLSSEL